MEIRDPIHGSIKISKEETKIIEHPFFQRLRSIKQLGFSEYVFPGATHTRYLHSIGVMNVVTKVFNQLFKNSEHKASELLRLKETVRLASLLHDIGHAPLSHTTEFVMPMVSTLNLPGQFHVQTDRKATHEDYTIKSIVDSSLTQAFTDVKSKFGVDPYKVAELILGCSDNEDYFTLDRVNYFPLLHQLVSSEMDCDRMDYLLRDSYFCGVSYGKFDLDWIIDNLKITLVDSKAFLGISERAIATFDDFLLSRFHMFLMVYFHYKSVCLEKMLKRFFDVVPGEYQIPSNIEDYLKHDDHLLMKVLRKSDNFWAKNIIKNSIPTKIHEVIGTFEVSKMHELESYLKSERIDYIKCSSKGRLSKYYNSENEVKNFPIKVVKEHGIISGQYNIRDIDKATDLYNKFSKTHQVSRIHCFYDNLHKSQKKHIKDIITKAKT